MNWSLFLVPYCIYNIYNTAYAILLFSNIMIIFGCLLNYISIPRLNIYDDTITIRNISSSFYLFGFLSMIIGSIHGNMNYFAQCNRIIIFIYYGIFWLF